MPTLKEFAKQTGTPVRRRWSEVYDDVQKLDSTIELGAFISAIGKYDELENASWEQVIEYLTTALANPVVDEENARLQDEINRMHAEVRQITESQGEAHRKFAEREAELQSWEDTLRDRQLRLERGN